METTTKPIGSAIPIAPSSLPSSAARDAAVSAVAQESIESTGGWFAGLASILNFLLDIILLPLRILEIFNTSASQPGQESTAAATATLASTLLPSGPDAVESPVLPPPVQTLEAFTALPAVVMTVGSPAAASPTSSTGSGRASAPSPAPLPLPTVPAARHRPTPVPAAGGAGASALPTPLSAASITVSTAGTRVARHSLAFENPHHICGYITPLQMILVNPSLRAQFETNIRELCALEPHNTVFQAANKLVFETIPAAEASSTRVIVDAEPIRQLLIYLHKERFAILRYGMNQPHYEAKVRVVLDDLIDGLRVMVDSRLAARATPRDYSSVSFNTFPGHDFKTDLGLSFATGTTPHPTMPQVLRVHRSTPVTKESDLPLPAIPRTLTAEAVWTTDSEAHTYTLQSFGIAVLSEASYSDNHYYAYVKHADGTWWQCNDQSITQVSQTFVDAVLSGFDGEVEGRILHKTNVVRDAVYVRS